MVLLKPLIRVRFENFLDNLESLSMLRTSKLSAFSKSSEHCKHLEGDQTYFEKQAEWIVQL